MKGLMKKWAIAAIVLLLLVCAIYGNYIRQLFAVETGTIHELIFDQVDIEHDCITIEEKETKTLVEIKGDAFDELYAYLGKLTIQTEFPQKQGKSEWLLLRVTNIKMPNMNPIYLYIIDEHTIAVRLPGNLRHYYVLKEEIDLDMLMQLLK